MIKKGICKMEQPKTIKIDDVVYKGNMYDRLKDAMKLNFEQTKQLYEYLQGDYSNYDGRLGLDENKRGNVKLSSLKAFRIIYYLQEELNIIPDSIERCQSCNDLYDTCSEGKYDQYGSFCDSCL